MAFAPGSVVAGGPGALGGLGGPAEQGEHVAKRALPVCEPGVQPCRVIGRRFPGGRGGPQRVLQPARALRVAISYSADQLPGGLGQPVLQVSAGPPDLLGNQAGGLTVQVGPGPAPAGLARNPSADGPSQQLGLPGLPGHQIEEPQVRRQVLARPR